ncbi:hypothetical protein CLV33_101248 [Jejuia pallidilutea]|uniref:Uncharacterized protein n=1 Tax=Jejuia pallidilutea TaxID=504487 RepID=A0A362X372_9FLAO|nr:hypothetical protein [Jejuia pallidilutea]PQV51325.1 hypothetical protein CLV33_101248 [Jejuia pallidilutea]
MNSVNSLLEKIETAKQLDFGDILSKTLELFKKTWTQGIILVLLLLLIMLPFFTAIYVPMFNSVMEQVESGGYDPNDASSLLQEQSGYFQYLVLGVTFVMSFFSTAFVAGFYRIIKKIDFNETFGFKDFFYFFKSKYLGKIFAIAAFSLLIALLNLVSERFLPALTASLLNAIISVIFSVYTALFVVFFAFNPHLESSDFFVLSFRFGSKKWFLIFGLLFVTVILGMLGIVACFIGVLFTISIVYLPTYLVYKDVFGFENISDIDKIGIE